MKKGIAWFDPRTPPFRLVGFPWIGNDKVYRRLPVKPQWKIRGPVDRLANSTAGGQIHFKSDSPKILLRVKLLKASGMYHMPATGQSGFDLYLGRAGKQRYLSTTKFATTAKAFEATLFNGANAGESIRETLAPFIEILRTADQEIPKAINLDQLFGSWARQTGADVMESNLALRHPALHMGTFAEPEFEFHQAEPRVAKRA